MEWYEEERFWEFYLPILIELAMPEQVREQVDRILELLGVPEGARILDLGCGIGRHCLELARRGYRVTGVDRTARYLELARARSEAEGLEANFLEGDMREFRREATFDAVISMFTSFGYFQNPADDAKVLINVYDSLRPGGAFLIDVQGKENLARVFQERDWRPVRVEGREILLLEERRPMPLWEGIQTRYIFIDEGRRAEFTTFVRIYAATELVRLLHECGFSSVDVYGDFSGRPYDHTASRLIAVARK